MTMLADAPIEGRFVGAEHRFPIRVYFEDTDLSGVVYHANYLRYMERARSDMLRQAGIDQRATMEATGDVWTVASLAIRYRAPARLEDALVVHSRILSVRAAAIVIQQTVRRDGQNIAEAEVTAAFVSREGRPRRQPAAWLTAFRSYCEGGTTP